ncbi:MAG: DUF29 domain-containing protein [Methylotetracoccus sp.]|nr:DUF29 domain-containing protein [Methylotetracoccus sp.]
MKHSYDADIVAWAQEQARLLRAHRFDALDIEHIAEEIEDVGKSEQRELANRMAVLLAHLLKWQYQPERRGNSWAATIRHQRQRMARRLERTPSLQSCLIDAEWWADAWGDACSEAAEQTGMGFDAFPSDCPWTAAAILSAEFWPESVPQ